MTTTPESWDDVGHLRLQVDCIAQKMEHQDRDRDAFQEKIVSELQKLRDEVVLMHAQEQEQKKETCQWKGGTTIIVFLFGCALAMHIFTHRLPDDLGKPHLDIAKASNATIPVLGTEATGEMKRSVSNGQQLKEKLVDEVESALPKPVEEAIKEMPAVQRSTL